MQTPVLVLHQNTQRESGRKAQMNNINAAKAVADIIRTTLGPRSMLKMLLDPMGGIVITNDGHAILREIDVSHPAAKSMLELARSQDEEVGDGTTSVIILSGEMLLVAKPFLERQMHPTVIVRAFQRALDKAIEICDSIAVDINPADSDELRALIRSCIGTKWVSRYGDLMTNLALEAVMKVAVLEDGRKEVDIKRYAKVEKLPGGELSECRVLDGVMFNKDVTHSKMRRRIENPRILLLDCPLEYKKAESAMNIELTREEDFEAILRQEEEFIAKMCADIAAFKPDLVITEKGLSDLAQHFFIKNNITAIRRLRKTDNNRIARAVGATVVSRTDEITEADIGTGCGLFEVRKMGDEYFTFLEQCKEPKACTILLRGASKDALMEIERNLQDAMLVARNVVFEPKLLPGGGATEMAISVGIAEAAKEVTGVEAWPFRAVGMALEVIPRTLAQNCGADVVRLLTELRAAKQGGANPTMGIDGTTGKLVDIATTGVYDPYSVKVQTIKTAVESACMLLRIDDIVSGLKYQGKQ
jgi:T-complex protein 1 subunit gamma